jgi:RecB family exonuclease
MPRKPERFSASVAGRHIACHASANLDLAIPHWVPPVEDRQKDNAANQGTLWHTFFAKVAEMRASDMKKMVSALDYVAELRSTRRFKVLVEHPMKATWLKAEPGTTPDLVLYTQDEIHVLDLKTGKIPVDVVDNPQLKFGAVTAAHLAPKAKGVTVHILQPWANGNDWAWVSADELKQFMDEAIAAEAAILAGDTTFSPSDECKFCPAYPHSRGAKGKPMCPVTLELLYPKPFDEDSILDL